MNSDAPIRIVMVDDHPLMREGLRALVASLPDIEVVGEAGDGEAARRETQLTHPDIVIMDLNMPGTLGEVVAEHFGRHPDADMYTSQPGLGVILGARVMAEFGDDPKRYTDAKGRKN